MFPIPAPHPPQNHKKKKKKKKKLWAKMGKFYALIKIFKQKK